MLRLLLRLKQRTSSSILSIEAEGMDRTSIVWPGNQLDLVQQLSELVKPLVVAQFGGGQIDDTALLNNSNVNSLVWGGYPGMYHEAVGRRRSSKEK